MNETETTKTKTQVEPTQDPTTTDPTTMAAPGNDEPELPIGP